MEFLKANGIEDPGLMKEIDYQEVLNQQAIYGEELNMFSNKENQKEVSSVGNFSNTNFTLLKSYAQTRDLLYP